MKRIYLASSWRNPDQPMLVEVLRGAGYEVYDFRNPRSGGPVTPETPETGFGWKQCNPRWREADDPRVAYREMLKHPAARRGFRADFNAMEWSNTCVLALPSGRSAHAEFGWLTGAGRKGVVYIPPIEKVPCRACTAVGQNCPLCGGLRYTPSWDLEPELMYMIAGENPDTIITLSVGELLAALR